MNAELVYPVLWINATNVPPGVGNVAAWSVNNVKCKVCMIVTEIFGTSESVVPWLCECEEKSAAQSSKPGLGSRITSIHWKYVK